MGQLLERSKMGEGSVVLDVPVGTGRFFPFYEQLGYKTIGVDASPDMLSEAEQKTKDIGYDDVTLQKGDIRGLELASNSVDLSVCIRLLNWFDFGGFQRALSELRRVSTTYVLVGVRMSSGRVRLHVRPYLRQAYRTGKQILNAAVGRNGVSGLSTLAWQARRVVQKRFFDTPPSGDRVADGSSSASSSEVTLVDHPEEAVREEFWRQGFVITEEKQVLVFTGNPQLFSLGMVEELPYRIFLLRV